MSDPGKGGKGGGPGSMMGGGGKGPGGPGMMGGGGGPGGMGGKGGPGMMGGKGGPGGGAAPSMGGGGGPGGKGGGPGAMGMGASMGGGAGPGGKGGSGGRGPGVKGGSGEAGNRPAGPGGPPGALGALRGAQKGGAKASSAAPSANQDTGGFMAGGAAGYGGGGGGGNSGAGGLMAGPVPGGGGGGGGTGGMQAGGSVGGMGGGGLGGPAAPVDPGFGKDDDKGAPVGADEPPPLKGDPTRGPIAGLLAIERRFKWRLLFFVGACGTVSAGSLAMLYLMFHLTEATDWAPCTFTSSIFLTLFGVLMFVLDVPPGVVVNADYIDRLKAVQLSIFTFLLFLTRFMGRGLWYLFLSCVSWVVLYDSDISPPLGIAVTVFCFSIGFFSMAKGALLSRKLHVLRERILLQKDRFQPKGDLRKEQFSMLVAAASKIDNYFSEADLDFVIQSLAFSPQEAGIVTLEEFEYWMLPHGSMMFV